MNLLKKGNFLIKFLFNHITCWPKPDATLWPTSFWLIVNCSECCNQSFQGRNLTAFDWEVCGCSLSIFSAIDF